MYYDETRDPNSRFNLAREALYERAEEDLREELGREPTEDEIQRRVESMEGLEAPEFD